MKRNILILFGLLLIGNIAAQKKHYLDFNVGYNYDINMSNFSYTSQNMNGYHAGLMYDYKLKSVDGLGIGIGFNFAQTFFNYEGTDLVSTKDLTPLTSTWAKESISVQKYEIPISLSYSFKFNNDWALKIYTGPKFIFASTSISTIGSNNNTTIVGTTPPWSDFAYPFYVSWNIGAQLSYKDFYVGINYDISLYDIMRDQMLINGRTSGINANVLNDKFFVPSSFSLSVGYRFGIK